MSSRLSEGRNKDAHRIFSISFIFALIMGSLAWAGLLFGANFFAELYQKPGLQYPLFILAPTTFIVALLGTCRGYFQGHRNMVPTAVSQVLEQIVNAIVSVLAASLFVRWQRIRRVILMCHAERQVLQAVPWEHWQVRQ